MDNLKAFLENDDGDGLIQEKKNETASSKKNLSNTMQKNMELAKMWEDAAEYEKELESFEKELAIINANPLQNLPAALTQELPDKERNYGQELKSILSAIWTYKVETEKTHPIEQLKLIKEVEFRDVIEKLTTTNPDYTGNFEKEMKLALVKRWEMLIEMKKEHIKEEEDELYIAGLKPSFVKRMYKQIHGQAK